jgi:hypothetical protein
VKVYFVVPGVAVEMVAGLQVPVMLLTEVVGKVGAVLLRHIGATAKNNGTVKLLICILSFVMLAHCPAVGVKV